MRDSRRLRLRCQNYVRNAWNDEERCSSVFDGGGPTFMDDLRDSAVRGWSVQVDQGRPPAAGTKVVLCDACRRKSATTRNIGRGENAAGNYEVVE